MLFIFQEQDGIRDFHVTGVQTCALPICTPREFEQRGLPPHPALQKAADRVLSQQIQATAIPKRFSIPMREIWELQPRLAKTQSRRCVELLTHPRFRAAYDFVLLREQSGENLSGIGKF